MDGVSFRLVQPFDSRCQSHSVEIDWTVNVPSEDSLLRCYEPILILKKAGCRIYQGKSDIGNNQLLVGATNSCVAQSLSPEMFQL